MTKRICVDGVNSRRLFALRHPSIRRRPKIDDRCSAGQVRKHVFKPFDIRVLLLKVEQIRLVRSFGSIAHTIAHYDRPKPGAHRVDG
jgi:hypothetical protein